MGYIALICSDIHIRVDGLIWLINKRVYGDVIYSLLQISDLSKKHNVPSLIIAGDTFDVQKLDSSQVQILHQGLKDSAFEEIFFVQGQHDLSDPPWLSLLLSNRFRAVHHLNTESVLSLPNSDITISGLDWQQDKNKYLKLLSSALPSDLFVTHQLWKELHSAGEFSLNDIPRRFGLVISGDHHVPTTLNEPIRFLSPGSVYMVHIADISPKRVYLLRDDLELVPFDLKTRQFYDFFIADKDSFDQFMSFLSQIKPDYSCYSSFPVLENWANVHVPIIRLRIRKEICDDIPILELNDRKDFVLRVDIVGDNGFLKLVDLGLSNDQFLEQFCDSFMQRYSEWENEMKAACQLGFGKQAANMVLKLIRRNEEEVYAEEVEA